MLHWLLDGGQELQTIVHHKFPIKIIVVNNNGYNTIRFTQRNFFKGHEHIGIGTDSGDLSFPAIEAIAKAYGLNYFVSHDLQDLDSALIAIRDCALPCICEIVVSPEQKTEPKAASLKMSDGSFVSQPLENMAPFLPPEEIAANMIHTT